MKMSKNCLDVVEVFVKSKVDVVVTRKAPKPTFYRCSIKIFFTTLMHCGHERQSYNLGITAYWQMWYELPNRSFDSVLHLVRIGGTSAFYHYAFSFLSVDVRTNFFPRWLCHRLPPAEGVHVGDVVHVELDVKLGAVVVLPRFHFRRVFAGTELLKSWNVPTNDSTIFINPPPRFYCAVKEEKLI